MKFNQAIPLFNQYRKLKVEKNNGAESDVKQFSIYMRNCDIEDVKIGDVLEFLNFYNGDVFQFERGTLIKKEVHLRKFFDFYRRQGYEVIDPYLIPTSRPKHDMPRICDEATYKKLISAIPVKTKAYFHHRNRALICLIWTTGLRLGEAISLNISDIDFKNWELVVRTEKSRGLKPFRRLPIVDEEAKESLLRWLKARAHIALDYELPEPDALFIAMKSSVRDVNKMQGRRFATGAASEMFRKCSNRAGIPTANAHALRHHYARDLRRRGADLMTVSESLGHTSIQSSRIYEVLEPNELSKLLRKLKTKRIEKVEV